MSIFQRVQTLLEKRKEQEIIKLFDKDKGVWLNKIQTEVRTQKVSWVWDLAMKNLDEWKKSKKQKIDE